MNSHPIHSTVDMRAIEMMVSHIFSSVPLRMEPTLGGISTSVFRLIYPNEIFYLRLLPDIQDSFSSEVAVHNLLHHMQVKVSEVIYFAHCDEALQRSVMVTRAIKGSPVIQSHALNENLLQAIVVEAGRDLAHINTISVDGFGWLRGRAEMEQLSAPYPTYKAFVLAGWESNIRYLASTVLSALEVSVLEQIVVRYASWLEGDQGHLAHGDFSSRHIFQEDGHYTGVIDFGDSQGTNLWHDLGYFHMRDGGPLFPYQLESALLSGYREIVSLPLAYEHHIRFTCILITVKVLAAALQRHGPDRFTQHQLNTLRHDLAALF